MRWAGIVAVAGLAFLVSGCMTAEERRAADEAQCRSYGFRGRTDAFAECLQRLDLFRRAENRRDLDTWDRPVVVYRPILATP
jgi:hypothetical protein